MQCRADRSQLIRFELRLFCLLTTLADPISPVSLRLIQQGTVVWDLALPE